MKKIILMITSVIIVALVGTKAILDRKKEQEKEIKQEIYKNLYKCTELKDFRSRNRRCVLLLDALNRKDTY